MHTHLLRIKRILIITLLLAAPIWYVPPAKSYQDILVVHFLDVGQGDAIWLQLPNGDNVLVDGGPAAAGPMILAMLQRSGVDHLDLLVATHSDADHIGGLFDIVGAIPVAKTWLDTWACNTAMCNTFHQLLAAQEVITDLVQAGDSTIYGSVLLTVLNPISTGIPDDNNHSIVLRVSHGTIDFLLTGDIEQEAESQLLASGAALEAEILKVAHHGAATSTSSLMLATVLPETAVISVGENTYGHPSSDVLQSLAEYGVRVLRTDCNGTIEVESNGTSYVITPTSRIIYLPLANKH